MSIDKGNLTHICSFSKESYKIIDFSSLLKKFDESVKNFIWRVNQKVYIIGNVNESQIKNFVLEVLRKDRIWRGKNEKV